MAIARPPRTPKVVPPGRTPPGAARDSWASDPKIFFLIGPAFDGYSLVRHPAKRSAMQPGTGGYLRRFPGEVTSPWNA